MAVSRDETGRQAATPDHRFGASPPLTIGIEEELLLVDEMRRMTPVAERVIEELDAACREAVSTEIFAAQIELKTAICGDAGAAAIELSDLRAAVRATGVGLLGAGVHPTDVRGGASVTKTPGSQGRRAPSRGVRGRPPPCVRS